MVKGCGTKEFMLALLLSLQVVLLAATGVIGYFMKEYRDDVNDRLSSDSVDPYDLGQYGRYEFFLYTTSVGVIIAIISLVGLFTGLLEKNGGALAVGCCHLVHSS